MTLPNPEQRSGAQTSWTGRLWRLGVVVASLTLIHFASQSSLETFWEDLIPTKDAMGLWPLVGVAIVFALCLAIPFVPGMEIGLAMMMLFGVRGVALVYLATLGGLSLSFLAGRWVSMKRIGRLLGWAGLERAQALMGQIDGLSRDQRLELLLSAAPGKYTGLLLRHRHLMLLVLLNLPGNAVLGGGGGIGFLVGASGLLSYPWYLGTVAIAILPFPLFFLWQAVS